MATVIADAARYVEGHRVGLVGSEVWELADGPGFAWIGLVEPDPAELQIIGDALGLHALAMEDATDANQRPKLEQYEDSLFVAMRTVNLDSDGSRLRFGELHAFVSSDFIVTVRHGPGADRSTVRADLEQEPERMAGGPTAVLQVIMDRVVDAYQAPAEDLAESVELLEEVVFSSEGAPDVEELYRLKRDILHFLGAIKPLVGPLEALVAGRGPVRGESEYFRDVLDNLTKVVDRTTTQSDLLTTILQANLAQLSVILAEVGVRQNEDMRRISAWVAIGAAPTIITGIYGMNFRNMPELGWAMGYPLSVVLILALCLLLYGVFRRAGWL